ncbi:MAG TPA: hypothetical protein VJX68_14460 [Candidatus Binatus sp.]|uniref:hypothetical protein n=1 Tax=Candidatus Binatus sp. TaxID=2811406 RepID=UPI002B498476|nr:hypothetical protein [Candidatus Binatus sp.]HKN14390.1 hypothetical protein [Candidatus Binatus sp.]
MLRPTLNELIGGMQRTIMEALMPELTSPYAQGQAMSAIGMLAHAAAVLESAPAYDAAETKDLRATFAALKRLGDKRISKKNGLRSALARAIRASAKNPPDRRAMEESMAAFATAVALGHADDSVARHVRGYIRRNLERSRKLLGGSLPSA